MRRWALHIIHIVLLSGAAFVTVAAQTAPPTEETQRGRLSGRLTNESGQPLANVVVMAVRQGAATVTRPAEASTDTDGRFRFNDLATGLYRLDPYAAGYVLADDPHSPPTTYRLGENATLRLVKGSVITGQITDARGVPMVAVPVQAIPVPTASKNGPQLSGNLSYSGPTYTDDRGIYRIYGLRADEYFVIAGPNPWGWPPNPYALNVPIYYPSSTAREGAKVVKVAFGEEATSIDIRYRYETGHTVAGQVLGLSPEQYPTLTLASETGGATLMADPDRSLVKEGPRLFNFAAVPDGTYQLTVQATSNNKILAATHTIAVKGADVTGLTLTAKPLAELRGRLTIVPSKPPECPAPATLTSPEVLLQAQRTDTLKGAFNRTQVTGDAQGAFVLGNLSGGTYRLNWQLPPAWYVRELQPANAKQTEPPQLFTLTEGATLNGANITIAYGAGRIVGGVEPPTEGAALPVGLRVYAIPAEPANANNTLRYADAEVTAKGAFELVNLAPGRYWLIAQVPDPQTRGPLWLNANERAKLRRLAEKLTPVELRPCQQMKAYALVVGVRN